MGDGGVRGMLVTLGAVGSGNVDLKMVAAFTAGVILIFVSFGYVISYINENLLTSSKNVKRVFAATGVISLIVGANFLIN